MSNCDCGDECDCGDCGCDECYGRDMFVGRDMRDNRDPQEIGQRIAKMREATKQTLPVTEIADIIL